MKIKLLRTYLIFVQRRTHYYKCVCAFVYIMIIKEQLLSITEAIRRHKQSFITTIFPFVRNIIMVGKFELLMPISYGRFFTRLDKST